MLVKNFDAGGGGGAGAEIVVASHNAPDDVKAAADYICDGVADEVEINNAILAAVGYLNDFTFVDNFEDYTNETTPSHFSRFVRFGGLDWGTTSEATPERVLVPGGAGKVIAVYESFVAPGAGSAESNVQHGGSGSEYLGILLAQEGSTSPEKYFAAVLKAGSVDIVDETESVIATSAGTFGATTDYLLKMTWDRTAGTMKVYVDGTLELSHTFTGGDLTDFATMTYFGYVSNTQTSAFWRDISVDVSINAASISLSGGYFSVDNTIEIDIPDALNGLTVPGGREWNARFNFNGNGKTVIAPSSSFPATNPIIRAEARTRSGSPAIFLSDLEIDGNAHLFNSSSTVTGIEGTFSAERISVHHVAGTGMASTGAGDLHINDCSISTIAGNNAVGISLPSAGARVTNTEIRWVQGTGVYSTGWSLHMANCSVSNCQTAQTDYATSSTDTRSIWLEDCAWATILGCEIGNGNATKGSALYISQTSGNEEPSAIVGNLIYGEVYVESQWSCTVSDNAFTLGGLYFEAVPSGVVSGNVFMYSPGTAITLDRSSKISVTGNSINESNTDQNPDVPHILITDTSATPTGSFNNIIANNTISGHLSDYWNNSTDTTYAIRIDNSSYDNLIKSNIVTSSHTTGAVDDQGTGTIYDSKIEAFAESGTVSTGTGVSRFRFPFNATIVDCSAAIDTAPVGSDLIVDVNINGTTAFTTQGNRPTITDGTNEAPNTTPDVRSISAGDYITVDVDQVGSSTPGSDLTVFIHYTQDEL